MRQILSSALLLAMGIATIGCHDNEGLLRTQGRLLKGGEPFITAEGEYIAITFVPVLEGNKSPESNSMYWAGVNQETGTFVPDGAQKKGMPPGKYRVAVELMKNKKDLWKGRFDGEKSPFIFEVDENTQEIVIDLDDPPPTGGLTANPQAIESAGG